jgi:hypothetical protein
MVVLLLPNLSLLVHFKIKYMFPGNLLNVLKGSIKLEPLKRSKNRTRIGRVSLELTDTLAAEAVNIPAIMQNSQVRWYHGKHVMSHAKDMCAVGTWIFARSPFSLVQYINISVSLFEDNLSL